MLTEDPFRNFHMEPVWIDGVEMQAYEILRKAHKKADISLLLSTEEQKRKIHDLVNAYLDNKASGGETFIELKMSETTDKRPVKLVGYTCSGEQDFGGLRLEQYQSVKSCKLSVNL